MASGSGTVHATPSPAPLPKVAEPAPLPQGADPAPLPQVAEPAPIQYVSHPPFSQITSVPDVLSDSPTPEFSYVFPPGIAPITNLPSGSGMNDAENPSNEDSTTASSSPPTPAPVAAPTKARKSRTPWV